MADNSTIQIPVKVKKDLDAFKENERETYADVIEKLLSRIREDEEAEFELSSETLRGIEEAKKDLRHGRVFSSKQLRKELGL
ncbi:MAG: hypothetical protein J4215_05340 [Candidatus Diapherotrites archaeon]|uniref:Uncharacterized protein n=1 Tax=Candidatus Iainarchaeum sp. TaxID=3101447 RepID=A0A8T4L3S8_9ARCH|nr:hypothetical protein [Candidatus Diapherotrites archaeon]